MEDMIKKIIEMDSHAREVTEQAKKDKYTAQEEISQKKAALRAEYIERAKKRIEIVRQNVKEESVQAVKDLEAQTALGLQRLKQIETERRASWVKALYQRVLSE